MGPWILCAPSGRRIKLLMVNKEKTRQTQKNSEVPWQKRISLKKNEKKCRCVSPMKTNGRRRIRRGLYALNCRKCQQEPERDEEIALKSGLVAVRSGSCWGEVRKWRRRRRRRRECKVYYDWFFASGTRVGTRGPVRQCDSFAEWKFVSWIELNGAWFYWPKARKRNPIETLSSV